MVGIVARWLSPLGWGKRRRQRLPRRGDILILARSCWESNRNSEWRADSQGRYQSVCRDLRLARPSNRHGTRGCCAAQINGLPRQLWRASYPRGRRPSPAPRAAEMKAPEKVATVREDHRRRRLAEACQRWPANSKRGAELSARPTAATAPDDKAPCRLENRTRPPPLCCRETSRRTILRHFREATESDAKRSTDDERYEVLLSVAGLAMAALWGDRPSWQKRSLPTGESRTTAAAVLHLKNLRPTAERATRCGTLRESRRCIFVGTDPH